MTNVAVEHAAEPCTDRLAKRVKVRYEQAVYGSFPFRAGGYAMLAASPGCRDPWLADFRAACRKFGEPPTGYAERSSLFACRLPSGPVCVVGVGSQGTDDRGRPGALAFHALFLSTADYWAIGASPFPISPWLRNDWSETTTLSANEQQVVPELTVKASQPVDSAAERIAKLLRQGRKVAIESAEPGQDLGRDTWQRLSRRVRSKRSIATWAFAVANGFDLTISPKLPAQLAETPGTVIVDPALLGVPATVVEPTLDRRRSPSLLGRFRSVILILASLIAVFMAVVLALALRDEQGDESNVQVKPHSTAVNQKPIAPKPSDVPPNLRALEDEPPLTDSERRSLAEALVDALDRFAKQGADADDSDPGALMEAFAETVRYSGPLLDADERQTLASSPRPEAEAAIRWDTLVRRFLADRALPGDFRARGTRAQIALLAWSYHSEAAEPIRETMENRLSPAETAQALFEHLKVDVPLRATPLVARYPALAGYLSFLGRLPRR